jgi:hypothetical protein
MSPEGGRGPIWGTQKLEVGTAFFALKKCLQIHGDVNAVVSLTVTSRLRLDFDLGTLGA